MGGAEPAQHLVFFVAGLAREESQVMDDPRRLESLPPDSAGAVGLPSLATAEKGARIFQHILQRIRADLGVKYSVKVAFVYPD